MNRAPKTIYLATFLISASVLEMEVALTRIFSVLTWHHFTYMIVSIALLGFGAAGSYLTIRSARDQSFFSLARISRNSFLYVFSGLFSFLLATRIHFEPLKIIADWAQLISLLAYYVLLTVPFFFAGLVLGSIITVYSEDINRIYFADLAGASFGSLFSVACIQYLGATNTILLVCLLGGITGLLLNLHTGQRSAASWISVAFLAALLAVGLYFDPYLIYAPSSKGIFQLANAWKGPDAIDYSKWHMVARVDITRSLKRHAPTFSGNINPKYSIAWEHRLIYQDGAAPTGILRSDGDVKKMTFLDNYLQAAPYVIQRNPRVLVIGVGGGIDVLIALYHDAAHVTGAEINPLTVHAIKETYADYAGRIFNRNDVEIYAAEGRHFVSWDKNRYDVIQLSGVDTFTALSSGAYALAENYLYTVEALNDFWDHLSDQGILSFSRWYFIPPRETLRLSAMMVEVMTKRGVANPASHIVIVNGTSWAETLMKKTPFTRQDIQQLDRWARANEFGLMYNPFGHSKKEFDKVIRSDSKTREKFYDEYFYEVRPSTDDRPFFFNYYKWLNVFRTKVSKYGFTTTNFPVALITHAISLIQILLLAAVGILYPMRKLRHTLFARPGSVRAMAYFSALGLGFIFVEIALIQKLMVFLGGPSYSLSITLFSILFFSGLGSFCAKRLSGKTDKVWIILPIILIALIPGLSRLLEWLIPRCLDFSLLPRAALSIFLIAPMSFFMGMPFPMGIQILKQHRPEWIPWAWATNSFMTVFGPLFCILLSMHLGFQAVFLIASLVYLGGFWVFRPLALHREVSSAATSSVVGKRNSLISI